MQSAPAAAARRRWWCSTSAPLAFAQSSSAGVGASSGGVAIVERESRSAAAAWTHEVSTLLASPIQATVLPAIGPFCSSKVITSAITWQGCDRRVRPLITGIGGVGGELLDHVVVEGADHDARRHSATARARCRRWSRRGRAASRLPVSMIGLAAELAHADVEGDAGAGRRLVEDHGERLAGERLRRRGRAALAFSAPRLVEDARSACADRGRRGRGNGGPSAHRPTPPLPWPAKAPQALASRRAIASSISASVTFSGGSRRTTFSPAPAASRPCVAQRGDDLGRRHDAADADQQALAAHLGDDIADGRRRRRPAAA